MVLKIVLCNMQSHNVFQHLEGYMFTYATLKGICFSAS